jgi:hypothetical protein
VLQREVPAMIAASLLLWLLAADGRIGRLDGALLGNVVGSRRRGSARRSAWSARTASSTRPPR